MFVMKKTATLLLICSIGLTSCIPTAQQNSPEPVTRKPKQAHNIVYLHKELTRFKSNKEAFNFFIANNQDVVVDFYADWCGPCKFLSSTLEQVAPHYPQIMFLKVNVDTCKELADAHSVTGIPALVWYKNGQQVKRTTGSKSPKELKALLNS